MTLDALKYILKIKKCYTHIHARVHKQANKQTHLTYSVDMGGLPNILHQVRVPLVAFNKCNENYPSNRLSQKSHVCAGNTEKGGVDACQVRVFGCKCCCCFTTASLTPRSNLCLR